MTHMDQKELLKMAEQVMEKAYVPYSNFKVGAALLAEDGRVFTGCNVENASYGLTICAERNAIFKAVSEGVRSFKQLAVIADTEGPVSPCGACRQVMVEFFGPDMPVVLSNVKGETTTRTVEELLPGAFKQEDFT
ncbi:MAG: cytidine deaminase [Bacillaceae bacterium]|nr:cytidine deaminase [Bacillaceae bacterium]